MKKSWPRVKISSVCDLIVDCVNKTAPTVNYRTPFKMIRTTNIKGGKVNTEGCRYVEKSTFDLWTRRAKVIKGDVLLTREAPMGEVGMVMSDEQLFLGQRVVQFRANPFKLDSRFLLYSFLSSDLQYQFKQHNNTGSTVSHIRVPDCYEFLISLPDLEYQREIGAVLNSIDQKIEVNNKINTELESLAKTIYDYWFVQFDFPISKEDAKAMGKPKLEGQPYRSSGGKMVWSEELNREVPEGWEVGPIGDWISTNKSGDWGKEIAEGNYQKRVCCIRGTDINGINGLEQCDPPTRYILEKNVGKVLQNGDFVIEISGGSPTQSTGRMALITEETLSRFTDPVICSNFCKPISIKDKKYMFNFAFYWNSLYAAGIFFGYEGKTSGIKNFLFDSFVSTYHTVKPPRKLAEQFYDLVFPFQKKKQMALKENQELASLRDWLLPMLMNGQVKVRMGSEPQKLSGESELQMVAEKRGKYFKAVK